ncbi:hypothetical protein OESDEN_24174 [Oesophagostomum dentatum]|uniref:Uncharacterized protein n=1 Tax=Oesophagostomum dentatum TaxID=61180 RepID=A0A0B1RX54_OESDE|nr:hypothetical protein OESDEN_24174 [Oesophagostomum dentatum]
MINDSMINSVFPEPEELALITGNGTDHTTGDDEGTLLRGDGKPFGKDDDTSLGSSLVTNSCWIITLIYVLSLSLKNS